MKQHGCVSVSVSASLAVSNFHTWTVRFLGHSHISWPTLTPIRFGPPTSHIGFMALRIRRGGSRQSVGRSVEIGRNRHHYSVPSASHFGFLFQPFFTLCGRLLNLEIKVFPHCTLQNISIFLLAASLPYLTLPYLLIQRFRFPASPKW